MRLYYSPLYHGMRLAYTHLIRPTHRAVAYGAPIVLLSANITQMAHANVPSTTQTYVNHNSTMVIDDVVFSEVGFNFEQLGHRWQPTISDKNNFDILFNHLKNNENFFSKHNQSALANLSTAAQDTYLAVAKNANTPTNDPTNSPTNNYKTAVNRATLTGANTNVTVAQTTEPLAVEARLEAQSPLNTSADVIKVSDKVSDNKASDNKASDNNEGNNGNPVDTNNSVSDSKATENATATTQTLGSVDLGLIDNIAVADSAVATNLPQDTQSRTKVVDIDDKNVQQSLQRLAEFYELKQAHTEGSQSDVIHAVIEDTAEVVMADSIAPVIEPKLFNRKTFNIDSFSKPASPPRCEGVWVTPNNRSNYQYAVNKVPPKPQQPSSDYTHIDATINRRTEMYAESDYAYYDNERYIELLGDVKVVQGAHLIESERVVMDLEGRITGAQGEVLFTDSARYNNDNTPIATGLIGVASQLSYDANTGKSTAHDVAFASVPMQAHGYAATLNRPNDTQIELDEVMFTTCPPTDRKWGIQAKQIDVDTDTGRAEAYNATFRLGDVPILYLPYFNFPIDSRRSSGFLVPTASVDSDNGLQVSVPYYLNLAPNYDSTVTTQVFSNRNPMLTGEFRYLTNYGEGELVATYLPNDKQYDHDSRHAVFYEHHWSPPQIDHLSLEAVYNYVSDPDYINDFDKFGTIDNDLNLPRRAQANYYNDYLTGQFKIETFQTLEAKDAEGNRILDKDKPYSRLPQLSLKYQLPVIDNVDIEGIHDSAYFKKSITDGSENEKSGVRIYNELSASLPFERSWGYITPKAKLQHLFTSYDETSRLDNNLSKNDSSNGVFVPQFSVDAGLNYYQAGSPLGWFDDTMGGYQLLSPRLKYVYAPYKSQNEIPNFNTRVASINYEQLFEDSWLLGYDRISDNHAITPGLNYRYIDAMGVTRFNASIAKQYFLDNGQITLENNKPLLSDNTIGAVWNTSAQPYRNLWFNFDGALKSNDEINFLTAGIRYQPTQNSLLNIGYVKRARDEDTNQLPLTAWTASTVFPINERTRLLAQAQYDHKRHEVIESTIGIDYEDCCYGFSVYGREYYNDLNLSDDPTRAIMFEFRINGLGRQRSGRLDRLATEKITGFETINDNWRY